MNKILITGSNGFIAKHLIYFLASKNYDIYCLTSQHTSLPKFFTVNPLDSFKIHKIIHQLRPDTIYHLAGSTSNNINISRTINFEYCKNIILGLEKANLEGITKLLTLGSAAEYGYLEESELPVQETKQALPFSIYGTNKLDQTNLVLNWQRKCSGYATILRPFTILGVGMPTHLAIGNFELQLSNIVAGKSKPVITTGNIESYRDFIDVKDFVKIMHHSINKPEFNGEIFNVCSGIPVKIGDILDYMIHSLDFPISKSISTSEMRLNDMRIHYGSNHKLASLIEINNLKNWKQSIDEIIQNIRANK